MASTKLWSADTAAPWAAVQQGLANAWQAKASERLQELNRWYEGVLPGAISSRAPHAHITAAELVQLVDWKLSYGKWRPRLLDYAKAATEQQVQEASRKAFALLPGSSSSSSIADNDAAEADAAGTAAAAPAAAGAGAGRKRKQQPDQPSTAGKRTKAAGDAALPAPPEQDSATAAAAAAAAPSAAAVKAALDALTVLKGVGPATASAALAAADGSGSTPYMGDEALQAACGGRDYTAKAYLQLLDALRAKADWLRQIDPGTGWTAVLVERCLYAAALQEKAGPTATKAASATKAATKPSRGAKASSKAGQQS